MTSYSRASTIADTLRCEEQDWRPRHHHHYNHQLPPSADVASDRSALRPPQYHTGGYSAPIAGTAFGTGVGDNNLDDIDFGDFPIDEEKAQELEREAISSQAARVASSADSELYQHFGAVEYVHANSAYGGAPRSSDAQAVGRFRPAGERVAGEGGSTPGDNRSLCTSLRENQRLPAVLSSLSQKDDGLLLPKPQNGLADGPPSAPCGAVHLRLHGSAMATFGGNDSEALLPEQPSSNHHGAGEAYWRERVREMETVMEKMRAENQRFREEKAGETALLREKISKLGAEAAQTRSALKSQRDCDEAEKQDILRSKQEEMDKLRTELSFKERELQRLRHEKLQPLPPKRKRSDESKFVPRGFAASTSSPPLRRSFSSSASMISKGSTSNPGAWSTSRPSSCAQDIHAAVLPPRRTTGTMTAGYDHVISSFIPSWDDLDNACEKEMLLREMAIAFSADGFANSMRTTEKTVSDLSGSEGVSPTVRSSHATPGSWFQPGILVDLVRNIDVGAGNTDYNPVFTTLERLISQYLACDDFGPLPNLLRLLHFVLAKSDACKARAFCALRSDPRSKQGLEDVAVRSADGMGSRGCQRQTHGDEKLAHILQCLLSKVCDYRRQRWREASQEAVAHVDCSEDDLERREVQLISLLIASLKTLIRPPERERLTCMVTLASGSLPSVLLNHMRQPPELLRTAVELFTHLINDRNIFLQCTLTPATPSDSELPNGNKTVPVHRSVLDRLARLLTSETSEESAAIRWSVVQFFCEACCIYPDAPTVLLQCETLFPHLALMLQKAMQQYDGIVQQEIAGKKTLQETLRPPMGKRKQEWGRLICHGADVLESLSAGHSVDELLRKVPSATAAFEAVTFRLTGVFGCWDGPSRGSTKSACQTKTE